MLNQQGDHSHYMRIEALPYEEAKTDGENYECIGSTKFYPLADLDYNAQKNTQYLKDDSLKFRLKIILHTFIT